VAYVVFGCFDAVAVGAKPTFLIWALFALAVSLPQVVDAGTTDSANDTRLGVTPHDRAATGAPAGTGGVA
jgi:hypothetical protein